MIESDLDSPEERSDDDFVIPQGQTERQRAKFQSECLSSVRRQTVSSSKLCLIG